MRRSKKPLAGIFCDECHHVMSFHTVFGCASLVYENASGVVRSVGTCPCKVGKAEIAFLGDLIRGD